MKLCSHLAAIWGVLGLGSALVAQQPVSDSFQAISCPGAYHRHLQGLCTNERDAIYWSWTEALVKTDAQGRLLKQVTVASHHGDPCFHDGRLYVPVNLGKFDLPAGQADSWIYVYDGETLAELSRHPVPELVHGAGGMCWHDGRFIVVGGLPPGIDENYLYEYDEAFHFRKRHVLASGYTLMGIQTVKFADGAWWFGCYGKPPVLLKAERQFRFTGKWEFDAAFGIVPISGGRFLIGKNTATKGVGNQGRVVIARPDPEKGLVTE